MKFNKVVGLGLATSVLVTGVGLEEFKQGSLGNESQRILGGIAEAADASAVNDANLQLKGFENAKVYDMTKLADPTGATDSSEVFHKILGESVNGPIVLNLGNGYYKFDSMHNIEVLNSKGVKIIGSGATIDYKNNKTTNLPEFYALQLHMKRGDNIGVQIEGVTFDGHRNEQDMFFTFNNEHLNGGYGGDVSSFYKTRLAKGVFIGHAEDVSVSNTTFQNAYGGYSLILEGYRNVNYKNLKLDNVGGDGQTDSLGMGLYFSGHTFDDATINMDNVFMNGKVGDKPQSNAGSGFSNPGDPSYYSWIGVVIENGTIQNGDSTKWLADKNTTMNITNSTFNNVEHTFHVESMAGNVAVNMNNVKTKAKAFGISAGIKGKYQFTGNKLDVELVPYGRNATYGTMFSSEFGDDARYHNGYNANLTDANGGAPLHSNLVTNSKVTYLDLPKTPAGAPGMGEFYATGVYGNQVNANFECTQFDNLANHFYANGGGYLKDVVFNLWEKNPNPATFDGIKGDPGAAGVHLKQDNVVVNEAGAWTNLQTTCPTPTFPNFSGSSAPVLDSAVTPAPIGGGGTTTTEESTTEAPTTELPTTEVVTTEAPTTEVVTTEAPTTEVVTTEDNTTEAPTTEELTTEELTTEDKTTEAPTMEQPTTELPTTEELTTEAPTTEAPTTEELTTEDKTTELPTTEVVTTEVATTEAPTTEELTTEDKTTEVPTTEELTTEDKTTELPTTEELTTEDKTTEELTSEDKTEEDPFGDGGLGGEATEELITTEEPTTEVIDLEDTTEELTTEVVTTEDKTTESPTTEELTTEDKTTEDVKAPSILGFKPIVVEGKDINTFTISAEVEDNQDGTGVKDVFAVFKDAKGETKEVKLELKDGKYVLESYELGKEFKLDSIKAVDKAGNVETEKVDAKDIEIKDTDAVKDENNNGNGKKDIVDNSGVKPEPIGKLPDTGLEKQSKEKESGAGVLGLLSGIGALALLRRK